MTLKRNKVHEIPKSVNELEFKTDLSKLKKLAINYAVAEAERLTSINQSEALKRAKHNYKFHLIQMRRKYGSSPLYAEYNEMIISSSTFSHQDDKTDNVSDDLDKSEEKDKQKEHGEHREDTSQQSIGVAA